MAVKYLKGCQSTEFCGEFRNYVPWEKTQKQRPRKDDVNPVECCVEMNYLTWLWTLGYVSPQGYMLQP